MLTKVSSLCLRRFCYSTTRKKGRTITDSPGKEGPCFTHNSETGNAECGGTANHLWPPLEGRRRRWRRKCWLMFFFSWLRCRQCSCAPSQQVPFLQSRLQESARRARKSMGGLSGLLTGKAQLQGSFSSTPRCAGQPGAFSSSSLMSDTELLLTANLLHKSVYWSTIFTKHYAKLIDLESCWVNI